MTSHLVSVMPAPQPRIAAVGTALPESRYDQEEIATLLDVAEGLPRRFFRTSGIEWRYFYRLPCDGPRQESQSDLLKRHRAGSLEVGGTAMKRCLQRAGLSSHDIDFLCCVSSTGFMMPGISAMYVRHLGIREDCQRVDIVGMGCHAALNGLNAVTGWAVANPGRHALMVCCEINSAIYVRDDRVVTSVVNSLFGDGCAAVLVTTNLIEAAPEILGFSSKVVPDAWRAISYDWSQEHGKFELYLDKAIPDVLGAHSAAPVDALLEKFDLCRCDVSHWLIHAGGKKVISAIQHANGLCAHDVRHSTDVLRLHGNMGSPTVMFSYERLLAEGAVSPGQHALMVTMGPGATIETMLLRW